MGLAFAVYIAAILGDDLDFTAEHLIRIAVRLSKAPNRAARLPGSRKRRLDVDEAKIERLGVPERVPPPGEQQSEQKEFQQPPTETRQPRAEIEINSRDGHGRDVTRWMIVSPTA